MSSRLMPRRVCVRSLVPKLKNSAVSAISSAVSAPRGHFDHRADQVGQLLARSPPSLPWPTRWTISTCRSSSFLKPTSGIMTSGLTLMPFLRHVAAASKMARACISVISGIDDAQAAAAEAEHRVEFVQFMHAAGDLVGARCPACSASAFCWPCSCGRNSCSGGSSRRMRGRQALERPEHAFEILALVRQQLGQAPCGGPRRSRPGSSRASRRCGRLRRTCAPCGTGRCPPRRRRRRWRPDPAGRRWCGLPCGSLRAPVHELVEARMSRSSRSLVPAEEPRTMSDGAVLNFRA